MYLKGFSWPKKVYKEWYASFNTVICVKIVLTWIPVFKHWLDHLLLYIKFLCWPVLVSTPQATDGFFTWASCKGSRLSSMPSMCNHSDQVLPSVGAHLPTLVFDGSCMCNHRDQVLPSVGLTSQHSYLMAPVCVITGTKCCPPWGSLPNTHIWWLLYV